MFKKRSLRIIAILLVAVMLLGTVVSAALNYDVNGDGKTDVTDLLQLWKDGASADEQEAALDEALGGGDELHKNGEGQWEIWSSIGLYNMAKNAQAGDTFVLMQNIDMNGALWTPIENFNGRLVGNRYIVSNMKITQSVDGNMGFFGDISKHGYVEYFNIKDVNLIASNDAVNIGIISGSCSGTIDGCTAIGFVTDSRTAIPQDVYIGGMAGKLVDGGQVISRDVNKIPKDEEEAIFTISAKLGTRFADLTSATYERKVGIVGDIGTGSVDAGTLLQDLTGTMPDPNAIAWVDHADGPAYPLNLSELLAAINADGNSVITLQKDLTNNTQIEIPYSCTLDCNGYSITTPANSGNGIQINSVGSENKTFTLKNGLMTNYQIGVKVVEGAVVISNMTIVTYGGASVGLYDVSGDYASINRIEDSTLVSENWGCISFNNNGADMSATGITLANSTLISPKPDDYGVFVKRASKAGTVTIGENLNLYTCSDSIGPNIPLTGVDPVKLEETFSVKVNGKTYSDLSCWTTDESVLSTIIIAEVTNNGETVSVTNVKDMTAAVAADGNTSIKLVKDISSTIGVTLPYSCTLDMNQFSITSSGGNALTIAGAGTDNTVTTVKNGTLNHTAFGVSVDAGAIDLSNVTINGTGKSGASVVFTDPTAAYRADNKIENCYISNPYSECIKYNVGDLDFNETGVTISNTTLITAKSYVFGVSTARKSGIVDLKDGVVMYSPKSSEIAASGLYRFEGAVAFKDDAKQTVTVDGTQYSLNRWVTDSQRETINVLLIGNSLSNSVPEELYNIAGNAGYEVVVGSIYYPGCKSWQHWQWLNDDSPNYQFRYACDMGTYVRRGDMSNSKTALEDREWDYIVYQDWFMPNDASTLDQLYSKHQADAYKMMQYLKTNYPNAKHYYYQHWAWDIGHDGCPTLEAQEAMWARIETASTKFAAENDFILIPCGAAYEMARDDDRITGNLCQTDKLHDEALTGGQYILGCVFFETIFRESCIGDTWRAPNGPDEATHLALQEIAHATVAKIHGEDWVK